MKHRQTKTVKFNKAIALVLTALVVTSLASSVKADVVSDWNAIAVQAAVTAARPGGSGTLDVAMVHAAIYDAVQAIEEDYETYLVDIPNASGSPIAAAAKAAHDVLVNRFPTQATALDTAYANYLMANGIPPNDPGVAVGAKAAAAIIASRACDGSFPTAPEPFIGGTGIGQWRPTPPANSAMNPGPWQGVVAPFTLTRPSQFRSPPPPKVTSRQYATDYNEVKSLGALNNSTRTAAQTDQAQFYAGNFLVMMNAVVRHLSDTQVQSISESSRLFALTSMASADAIITVWNDKAHYNFWRPITAIQNGHLDGNSRTTGDPTWNSLIASPPYPDYSSGANGLASSTMRALENYFGNDEIKFSITTTNTGPTTQDTRSFTSFSAAAQEVVDARVLLGIHFRFADEASRTIGYRVADHVFRNYFQQVKTDVR